jgi:hypothetical protein
MPAHPWSNSVRCQRRHRSKYSCSASHVASRGPFDQSLARERIEASASSQARGEARKSSIDAPEEAGEESGQMSRL